MVCEQYRYLGVWTSEETQISTRVSLALKAMGKLSAMWESSISTEVRFRLYQTLVEPVLMYGLQVINISKKASSQLRGAAMRMMAGIRGYRRSEYKVTILEAHTWAPGRTIAMLEATAAKLKLTLMHKMHLAGGTPLEVLRWAPRTKWSLMGSVVELLTKSNTRPFHEWKMLSMLAEKKQAERVIAECVNHLHCLILEECDIRRRIRNLSFSLKTFYEELLENVPLVEVAGLAAAMKSKRRLEDKVAFAELVGMKATWIRMELEEIRERTAVVRGKDLPTRVGNTVFVWTDGSVRDVFISAEGAVTEAKKKRITEPAPGGSVKKGGFGVFFGPRDPRNVSEQLPAEETQTIGRAELRAILHVLERFRGSNLVIHADSQSAISGVLSTGGKAMPSMKSSPLFDLHQKVFRRMDERDRMGLTTKIKWVKGHSGDCGNEAADVLASSAALAVDPTGQLELLYSKLGMYVPSSAAEMFGQMWALNASAERIMKTFESMYMERLMAIRMEFARLLFQQWLASIVSAYSVMVERDLSNSAERMELEHEEECGRELLFLECVAHATLKKGPAPPRYETRKARRLRDVWTEGDGMFCYEVTRSVERREMIQKHHLRVAALVREEGEWRRCLGMESSKELVFLLSQHFLIQRIAGAEEIVAREAEVRIQANVFFRSSFISALEKEARRKNSASIKEARKEMRRILNRKPWVLKKQIRARRSGHQTKHRTDKKVRMRPALRVRMVETGVDRPAAGKVVFSKRTKFINRREPETTALLVLTSMEDEEVLQRRMIEEAQIVESAAVAAELLVAEEMLEARRLFSSATSLHQELLREELGRAFVAALISATELQEALTRSFLERHLEEALRVSRTREGNVNPMMARRILNDDSVAEARAIEGVRRNTERAEAIGRYRMAVLCIERNERFYRYSEVMDEASEACELMAEGIFIEYCFGLSQLRQSFEAGRRAIATRRLRLCMRAFRAVEKERNAIQQQWLVEMQELAARELMSNWRRGAVELFNAQNAVGLEICRRERKRARDEQDERTDPRARASGDSADAAMNEWWLGRRAEVTRSSRKRKRDEEEQPGRRPTRPAEHEPETPPQTERSE